MDDALVIVEMAGAPVGKGRQRARIASGKGRMFVQTYTPAKTRKYEAPLRLLAQAAMRGRPPFEGPLAMTVTAVMPIPQSWSQKKQQDAAAGLILPTVKPDWDNLGKPTDAFNEVVWRDDRQLADVRVLKVYGRRPCLRVEVRRPAGLLV